MKESIVEVDAGQKRIVMMAVASWKKRKRRNDDELGEWFQQI